MSENPLLLSFPPYHCTENARLIFSSSRLPSVTVIPWQHFCISSSFFQWLRLCFSKLLPLICNFTLPRRYALPTLFFFHNATDRFSATPFVPAKLAYDCLQSVPLHVNAARDLVDALPPYVEWQTTTSHLKNPPEGYQEPPVDIYGGLDSISSRIAAGGFSGEYDFANAIYTLFNAAHDGHFLYIPDIIGSVFRFRRSVALVSISDDGTSLPKIYVHGKSRTSLNLLSVKYRIRLLIFRQPTS